MLFNNKKKYFILLPKLNRFFFCFDETKNKPTLFINYIIVTLKLEQIYGIDKLKENERKKDFQYSH